MIEDYCQVCPRFGAGVWSRVFEENQMRRTHKSCWLLERPEGFQECSDQLIACIGNIRTAQRFTENISRSHQKGHHHTRSSGIT